MKEIYFDEINSTQFYAKDLVRDGKKDFVIYAGIQSEGRGRTGRTWCSKFGGLWFSFDLDGSECSKLITLAIGVAVRNVCEKVYGIDVKLKWPNDIFIEGKKVGGILCEKVQDRIIVGIGINTNIEDSGCDNSITFFSLTKKVIDNKKFMIDIIKECKKEIRNNEIISNFREHMAFKGEMCFVSFLGKKAKIIDITEDGHLLVETDNNIREIFAGEVNVCI